MKTILRIALLPALLLSTGGPFATAAERAKNVILFLGDAGGIPTLNLAGIYAHNRPLGLFIQQMPHLALADTSALDLWVTDSAASMTAIVTGRKTNNGMLSTRPGLNDRVAQPLKTILEYAEEKGLSTGIVTNMAIWDATPAACYAHAPSRNSMVDIFSQVFAPRFGDGIEVLIGKDLKNLFAGMQLAGRDASAALTGAGYRWFDSPEEIPADAARVASIIDGPDFDPQPVLDNVLQILSRNPKGYFLMVEWDMHAENVKQGLDRVIVMDELVRHVAGKVSADTLLIFTADHSFDLRLLSGKTSSPLAPQLEAWADPPRPFLPVARTGVSHSGEEVLVAAQGPGAGLLHGFISNTRIFEIMMSAYGWVETP